MVTSFQDCCATGEPRGNDIFSDRESEVRSYCRRFPNIFASAKNHEMIDELGNRYIDFLAGAGVVNYGHNNPKILARVVRYMAGNGVIQALDLHTTAKRRFLEAFDRLILKPRGLSYKVQFTGPTGSSAVEAALKLARKITGRRGVAAFTNGYHGMSLGALAASSQGTMRAAAGTGLPDVIRMPFDGYPGLGLDGLGYIESVLHDPGSGFDLPAAFIVETVQAEGGLKAASSEWLRGLAELARRFEILLIVDDIQAGCGRTGAFFSFEDAGLEPDIVCLSKAIGGIGFPMALVLMKEALDVWQPGEHIGTFRGHNLAFVAGTAAIELYWQDDSFERSTRRKGELIAESLERIARYNPLGNPVRRGRGMMQGLEWSDPRIAGEVSRLAFARGLIAETCGSADQVLKVLPPLTISLTALQAGLDILAMAVAEHSDWSGAARGVMQRAS